MRGLLLAFALLSASAAAHVVIEPTAATAGRYYAGRFRVGHGCGTAATTALRIELPAAIVSAKPQPKPGWTVEIERVALAEAVHGEGGAIRERVVAITWRGRLPADQFDEFGMMFKLPPAAGALYFPAVQSCDGKEQRWTMIPAAGQDWHSVPNPAPVLTVTSAHEGHSGH